MNSLVASFDRREHIVPFAFDVRSVGVHLMIQPSVVEDFLTFGHLLADGDADTERDDAEINDDFHDC